MIDMSPETMGKLVHQHKNIVGVKDATGRSSASPSSASPAARILSSSRARMRPHSAQRPWRRRLHLGSPPMLPRSFAPNSRNPTLAGDYAKALAYQDRLMPLHKAIFMEPGVCGAKYGLKQARRMSRMVRSPLVPSLEPATEAAMMPALKHAGLIA